MRNFLLAFVLFIAGAVFVLPEGILLASSTDGTIDSTYKYAWNENTGWIDFGVAEGNVHISDSALTGYAFGENVGWISLNCSNGSSCATADYKVSNDGAGNLSGYGWNENTGWINFNPSSGGAVINSSGEFTGYAYGENTGWIVFNCATTSSCGTVDYKVKTDWRPRSARPACNNSLDDDNDGKIDYPADPGCSSLEDTDETDPPGGGGILGSISGGSTVPEPKFQIIFPDGTVIYPEEKLTPVAENKASEPVPQTASVYQVAETVTKAVESILPSFLKPKPKIEPPQEPSSEEVASESFGKRYFRHFRR